MLLLVFSCLMLPNLLPVPLAQSRSSRLLFLPLSSGGASWTALATSARLGLGL